MIKVILENKVSNPEYCYCVYDAWY